MAGKARKRTPVVPLNDTDFEAGDLTEHTMPDGTPTNPDGTVASPGTMIDVAQAKKIGAVTSDAAQTNKSMARRMDRKAKGETNVPWNEKRALHLFDAIRGAFAPSTILVCIKDLETQIDHRPVPMQLFKSSMDLYEHVAKNCQRGKTSRSYEIIFKDIHQFSNRGEGTLTMPDMLEESQAVAALPQQQAPWMPPGPPYGGGYPPGGGYPGGYPGYPPQPQQPVQAPVQAAATPQPVPQYQPVPQPIVIPPGTDPATAQMLQSLIAEQRLSRESNGQLREMLAGALGGLEEFRRAAYQQSAQQQHAPPAPAPQAAPPPQPVQQAAPQPAPQQPVFLGYGTNGQPMWGYPPGSNMPGQPAGPWNPPQGVGAAPPPQQQVPPPPPQQVVPPPPPPAAAQRPQSIGDIVQTIQTAVEQLNAVKKAVGMPAGRGVGALGGDEEEEEEGPPPPPPPAPDPVRITTFGDPNDPNAMRVAHNTETGEMDIGTTIIGMAPAVLNMFTKAVDAASKLGQASEQAQRARPITVQGHAVPMQQRMVPLPPSPLPPRTA